MVTLNRIDDGAPQHDPRTHHATVEWVEGVAEVPTSDGPALLPVLRAVYTIEPLPITRERIKAEAQRRIISLTGAADIQSCLIKQLNANMRANELNDKRVSGGVLTQEEETEASSLRYLAFAIKHIRSRSNEIEALDPLPSNFASDEWWF